jgi:hypothetical protein
MAVYNKFLFALFGAVIAYVQRKIGIDLGWIGAEEMTGLIGLATAGLVYLIPNKPMS